MGSVKTRVLKQAIYKVQKYKIWQVMVKKLFSIFFFSAKNIFFCFNSVNFLYFYILYQDLSMNLEQFCQSTFKYLLENSYSKLLS